MKRNLCFEVRGASALISVSLHMGTDRTHRQRSPGHRLVSLKFGRLDLPLESAGARSILWVMDTLASKGWMVKVATAGHSGGAPVEQFYAAGYYRMRDAEQAVQRRLMVSGALDEPIIAVRELSASEIQELKLLELEVRRYV